MLLHQTFNYNSGSLNGIGWLIGLTHLCPNSRMGYFFLLNDRITTTNVAKATANINASNNDTGTTGPHDAGHADVATGCGAINPPFFYS